MNSSRRSLNRTLPTVWIGTDTSIAMSLYLTPLRNSRAMRRTVLFGSGFPQAIYCPTIKESTRLAVAWSGWV